MKTLITNPPWVTRERVGFRSNVRWPFTVSKRVWAAKGRPSYHFPIYQAYAAALFRENRMDVGVIDCSVDALDTEDYLGAIERARGDLIVIEVAAASFKTDIDVIRNVKERFGKPVVLVGPHCTYFHEDIIKQYDFIDYIARGEFEYTLLELAQSLSGGAALDGVLGITRREDGRVKVNPPRPFQEDLDGLPFPARDLYDWKRYHEPHYLALPWITIISSRGCPFRCIFCLWPQTMYGRRYRKRSARNVADEIEFCVSRYGPGEFFFDDDTFALDKNHVIGICDQIMARGLDILWSCMGRVDTVDRELLEAMYRAGCRKIKFGVETGSPAIMQTIKKGIDIGLVEEKFVMAKECGLEVHGTFMIGLPGETRETIYQTIELARRLPNDSLQFSIATPFPGTEFYRQCEENGWLVTSDWSNFDGNFGAVMSYPQLSKNEMEEMLYFALVSCQTPSGDEKKTVTGKFFHEARSRGLCKAVARAARYILKKAGLSRGPSGGLTLRGPVRLGIGWYTEENPLGHAGTGKEAFCSIGGKGGLPRGGLLTLTSRSPGGEPPFPLLDISLNGKPLASGRQGADWQVRQFSLPASGRPVEIKLAVDRTLKVAQPQKPSKFFGLLVKKISVEEHG